MHTILDPLSVAGLLVEVNSEEKLKKGWTRKRERVVMDGSGLILISNSFLVLLISHCS